MNKKTTFKAPFGQFVIDVSYVLLHSFLFQQTVQNTKQQNNKRHANLTGALDDQPLLHLLLAKQDPSQETPHKLINNYHNFLIITKS